MRRNHLLALALILNVLIVKAQDIKKVLFLGNSYTFYNDLPGIVEQLTLSSGDIFIHDTYAPGGRMLIQHATDSISINKINSASWDHVVLQEQSLVAAYVYSEFYNGSEQLLQVINPESTCINKTIFYMTWGRKNSSTYPYATCQELTTEAYNAMANIFGAEVSPVGVAWKMVRDDNDPIDLYDPDGAHPSYAGSYLAACVFYATIFDKSPVGLSYTGSLLTEDGLYLQQKAFDAYNEYVALGLIHAGPGLDTVTNAYKGKLNNTYFELNGLASGNTLNTTFDVTHSGFAISSNANTTLNYFIDQAGDQVASGSVPISMTLTPNQCNNQTATYPLSIDLSNVDSGLYQLKILLNGYLISDYDLSKTTTPLAGTTWKLAPSEGSLASGPTLRTISWWGYSSAAEMTARACQNDDQYVFEEDGTFRNVLDESTWRDSWQGVTTGCGLPVAPHDGTAQATWSYDAAASTITISGIGAYLGLPGINNNGLLSTPNEAVSSITYSVIFDGDVMYAFIDYGGGYWRFVFERDFLINAEEDIITNIDEIVNENLFNIYPNPASTHIQFHLDKNIDELTIRDSTGKVVLSKKLHSIDEIVSVSSLKRGLYIVQARVDNNIYVKKLSIR